MAYLPRAEFQLGLSSRGKVRSITLDLVESQLNEKKLSNSFDRKPSRQNLFKYGCGSGGQAERNWASHPEIDGGLLDLLSMQKLHPDRSNFQVCEDTEYHLLPMYGHLQSMCRKSPLHRLLSRDDMLPRKKKSSLRRESQLPLRVSDEWDMLPGKQCRDYRV